MTGFNDFRCKAPFAGSPPLGFAPTLPSQMATLSLIPSFGA